MQQAARHQKIFPETAFRFLAPGLAPSLALGLFALTLSGCGFTPLYKQPGKGDAAPLNAVTANIGRIDIDLTSSSRESFLVQERLNESLGHRADSQPKWHLQVNVQQRRIPLGLRVNNVASRYEYDLVVSFILKSLSEDKIVFQDTVTAATTYDSTDAPYAGLAASEDGVSRAAQQAADLVRIRLFRYFSNPKNSPEIAPRKAEDHPQSGTTPPVSSPPNSP